MEKEKEATANSRPQVRSMAITALMAAVLCIIGPLSVPIGPIPLSLCLVGIYLSAYVLGMKHGTIAVLIYILLGAFGAPVFTGFAGGPAKLFGPTGGYIAGYILTALICGAFIELTENKKDSLNRFAAIAIQLIGMIIGLAACYLLGTLWFMFSAKVGFTQALMTCVVPFVVFDLIKIALGMTLGLTIKKALKIANLI